MGYRAGKRRQPRAGELPIRLLARPRVAPPPQRDAIIPRRNRSPPLPPSPPSPPPMTDPTRHHGEPTAQRSDVPEPSTTVPPPPPTAFSRAGRRTAGDLALLAEAQPAPGAGGRWGPGPATRRRAKTARPGRTPRRQSRPFGRAERREPSLGPSGRTSRTTEARLGRSALWVSSLGLPSALTPSDSPPNTPLPRSLPAWRPSRASGSS